MKTLSSLQCVPYCPKRFEIALLSFFGVTLLYTLRVSLSLAVVAMVRVQPDNRSVSAEEVCPAPRPGTPDHVTSREGEFDWSMTVVSQVLAAYHYGYISTQLLGGYAAERFGTKYVFGLAITSAALLNIISPLAIRTHFLFFYVVRVLQGLFGGMALPSLHWLMSKWFPPSERAVLSSMLFSAIFVGSLVALGLSGVLITWSGWPLVYYFFGCVTLVWSVLWMLLAANSPRVHPRISPEERDYIQRELGVSEDRTTTPHVVPWLSILTSVPVWSSILVHFGVTWVLNFFLLLIPQYSKHILHFSIKANGFYSALPYVANWVGCVLSGILSQWLQRRQFISHMTAYLLFNGISMLGPALCIVAITLLGCDVTGIVVLLGVTMGLRGAYYGGSYLNHMDLALNYAGTIAGIGHTIINLNGILVPALAASVLSEKQTLAQWRIMFYVTVAILVVPYVLYLVFGSVEEQPWNKPHQQEVGSPALPQQEQADNPSPDDST
ncbi:sialin-like isoform X2 [Bacillus rossius redtenbacheri]|uniref:sialin-like isoform X2 n=1 Tax=Bacillus rossius redtenbacheri TaxID=93214 RepID=UPI002FDE338A